MRIPIRNLYYLLIYAWDCLDEAELVDVDAEASTSHLDLFARVLRSGISRLLRTGLDRGYIAKSQVIAGIKGKLEVSASVSRMLLPLGFAQCEFDELSHDVLHNQILKSTLDRLSRVRTLDLDLRGELTSLAQRMTGVQVIPIGPGTFRRVQLHRNIGFYRFLLQVCYLVHTNLLVDERTGTVRFRDFTRDRKQMADLFEEFVRNFYRHEQGVYDVAKALFSWNAIGDAAALQHLPSLATDVTLTSPSHTLVIETKYYNKPLVERFGQRKIRSGHLYQLYSYLKNAPLPPEEPNITSGILLYPVVEESFDFRYTLDSYPLRVYALDLDQHWTTIRAELLQLIESNPVGASSLARPARLA